LLKRTAILVAAMLTFFAGTAGAAPMGPDADGPLSRDQAHYVTIPPSSVASTSSAAGALVQARLRDGLGDTFQHNRAYNVADSMYVGQIFAGNQLSAPCAIPNGDNYQGRTEWAVIYNKANGYVGWVSYADLVSEGGTLRDCFYG